MKRTPRQILDLEIDEISLVDKGANQHATVTIAKSADGDKENYMEIFDEQGNPVSDDDLELGDVVYDAEGQAYELAEDDGEYTEEQEPELVGKSFVGAAQGAMTGVRNFGQKTLGPKIGGATAGARNFGQKTFGPKIGPKTAGQLANRRNAMIAGGALGAGAIGGGAVAGVKKSYSEHLREELSKALTDEDRDAVISKAFDDIEYLSEAAEIAKAAAEEERQIRLQNEYFEVAKSYELPFDPEELGGVLMRCAESLSPEDCEVIGKALEFASEANSALYDEYGSVGGGDNSDVLSQVHAIADGMVSKSDQTPEELIAEIFASNPAAYDDYNAGY